MKHILLLAMLACGGSAASESDPFGWCCEGFCGLTSRDTEHFETCTCDGIETGGTGIGRGECVERLTD